MPSLGEDVTGADVRFQDEIIKPLVKDGFDLFHLVDDLQPEAQEINATA